ncbi:hypothetical protein [Oceanobacillus halotolerans]|uniref:hypothetical protein n=1 Tax=Oceanobacillus halotolerans TaxID=2663380 RepID=UPI0013DBCA1C|nr:hypothetical protein [Oceanobacillus halotolerans]
MRIVLELLRIIFIFGFLGALGWTLIEGVYTINERTEKYSWLGGIGIFMFLFVLYRNRFQFSGWYKGKGRKKLPKRITSTFIVMAMVLIISPLLLGLF